MARRIHIPRVHVGRIALDAAQAHHVHDVLRLASGDAVEVFDGAGASARATLIIGDDRTVVAEVLALDDNARQPQRRVRVYSAVPKGERADWMVEKLSELGVDAFIPLQAERSVVVPKGTQKIERWTRIAVEAAKQSRRVGVMRIEPMLPLGDAIRSVVDGEVWFLSLTAGAASAAQARAKLGAGPSLSLFIGPEGGWTPPEIAQMSASQWKPVQLTDTILRIETAAVVAASLALIREQQMRE